MKYLILVPDGSGDEPIEALGGRTPLDAADMPNCDELARRGIVGMVRNIPVKMEPESDVATLRVMGYNPSLYPEGRAPFEAAGMGIKLFDRDVAFRANLMTLTMKDGQLPDNSASFDDLIIADHSAGNISTEEADQLIQAINEAFDYRKDDAVCFYTGVSYRNCMIMRNGLADYDLTPPHEVLGGMVGDYLPTLGTQNDKSSYIEELMRKSYEILRDHPVNLARIEAGKKPANCLWIWGQGTRPKLNSFYDKYGVNGAAISAVYLVKGIAASAGLKSVDVEGATGTVDTNYMGKAKAAMQQYAGGADFVFMHLEGPDECSHQGDLEGKIKCLENIDTKVLQPIIEYFRMEKEEFRILVVTDHRTLLRTRAHTNLPVPYVLYESTDEKPIVEDRRYCEKSGEEGRYFDSGRELIDFFFRN